MIPLKRANNSQPTNITTLVFTDFGHHDGLVNIEGQEYPILTDYNKAGKVTKAEDRPLAFAKKIIGLKKTRYFIKTNSLGKLYNPLGMYSNESKHNKQLKHTGTKEWEFHETGLTVFQKYLDFLRTKNVAYLNNAMREAF